MRLIAVFNIPFILLALVVGAAAAPSGNDPDHKEEGPSLFFTAPLYTFLVNSTIGGSIIHIG
jgi:hypothetical protein